MTVGGVALGLVAGVWLLLPSLCRSSEQGNLVKCGSNLRQIGAALTKYAWAHDGQYPPSLDVLLTDPKVDVTAGVFVCPSGTGERAAGATPQEIARRFRDEPGHNSYSYAAAGLTTWSATPAHVLAFEPPKNHAGGGCNVLYGDGRVEFQSKAEPHRLVAELATGHNPPVPAIIGSTPDQHRTRGHRSDQPAPNGIAPFARSVFFAPPFLPAA